METRRENRPAPMIVASGLLTSDMRLSVALSAKPCARDPPPPRQLQRCQQVAGGRATANPPGEDLPTPEATKRREAMQQHRLSRTPDSQS
jgi:hypothetical protein